MNPRPNPENMPEPSATDALFASVPRIDVIDGELVPFDWSSSAQDAHSSSPAL
ncbi:hypothetical protein FHX48_002360 [Microbacterium halimionae]|uniref:Uncharacterized protein n=1 Tax=Microbacterium halimionae TaxID=1526413 RepID=A0A7W3JQN2_9MICO|nr:hypothetical protein [Microbacterium halimionae]NII94712.1 hypothetical protein [Microbacterium halimionae]